MPEWDVVVIGRSYAALSTALVLGRARKSVLVIGDGPPRNATAPHAHALLSRDHTSPEELIRHSEHDLDRYESVRLERGRVTELRETVGHFTVRFGNRSTTASVVVLATGVNDDPMPVPGLSDLWGRGVYTCPFCDGHEHVNSPWALIGRRVNPHQAAMLRNWAASVTICHPDEDGTVRRQVRAAGDEFVTLDARPIRTIHDLVPDAGIVVEFDDGASSTFGAIFVSPEYTPNSQLAAGLGCALLDGGFIDVDQNGETTVRNFFAVGDVTRAGPHQMTLASADGVRAAIAITSRLLA